jgi:PadR family transcriptional regulator, regulatory protein AphA
MSLSHALLGLLAVAPASGYELTKEFELSLGRYAWQAGHTSIYPELGKLAGRGLVRVVSEGPRGSKTYDITDEGRAELRSWLLRPPGEGVAVRNEPVLRMFLLSALPPADQRLMLTSIAEHTAAAAAQVRALLDAPDDPGRGPASAGWPASTGCASTTRSPNGRAGPWTSSLNLNPMRESVLLHPTGFPSR